MKKRVLAGLCALLLFASLLPVRGFSAGAKEEDTRFYELPVIFIDGQVPAADGTEYEAATVRVTNTEEDYTLESAAAEWKVHGRSSARGAKKPFNLRFPDRVDLLGMGAAKDWVLIANLYDKTLIRNRLMYDLSGKLGMLYPVESRFAELYINGEYRGVYQVCESPQIDRERVAIRPAEGEFLLEVLINGRPASDPTITTPRLKLRFQLNGLRYLPPDQEEWLTDFFEKAESALLSGDRDEIGKYFDTESMVNGYILYEFSKNADLAIGSTRFIIRDGRIFTGAAWDFDLSCGNGILNCDYLHQKNGTVPCRTDGWYAVQLWYRELAQMQWFRERFAERYRQLQPVLVNLYEDNELGRNQIDLLTEEMREAVEHNYRKWKVNGHEYQNARPGEKTYELNVEYLRDWLKGRNRWILSRIDSGHYPKVLY